MILEYGVRNFLSFKEGAKVSFRLDKNVPLNISNGKDYSTIMCVKGANGSGKTQLLKGLAFILAFTTVSFNQKPESEIPIEPFGDSKNSSNFYLIFRIDGIEYQYELEGTSTRVLKETLTQLTPRKRKLIDRKNNEIIKSTSDYQSLQSVEIRPNASVISIAHQHQIEAIKPIYKYLLDANFNVSETGVRNEEFVDIYRASQLLYEKNEIRQIVVEFLKSCDIGIKDIVIRREQQSDKKEPRHYPIFIHENAGKDIEVQLHAESSGTKQLYKYIISYLRSLTTGGMLILDEFDLFLHPHILPKILELFTSEESNRFGSQLLFTTHHAEIMNECGRYRTYLVEKENNESFAYRLDEIPGDMLRNDRPISTPYREGRIGGVPKL